MKKMILVLAAVCGGLQAQNMAFQQVSVISGSFGGPVAMSTMAAPMIQRTVTGSPYSATETRHSLQILGDGTRIEHTDTSQVTRDAEGRTRNETPNMILIHDPIAGFSYVIDAGRKTVSKMPLPKLMPSGPVPQPLPFEVPPGATVINGAVTKSARTPVEEDLGTQVIDGVAAKGTRSMITIPLGEIGNDRAIQVVNERWYSDVLQTMVKTSNSDPRFGTTEFEMTNIMQTVPDPSLFEVPAGYTVTEPQTTQYRIK